MCVEISAGNQGERKAALPELLAENCMLLTEGPDQTWGLQRRH